MTARRRNQVTCRCDAYPFPHNQGRGRCPGPQPETRIGWAAFREDTRRSMRLFARLEMEDAR